MFCLWGRGVELLIDQVTIGADRPNQNLREFVSRRRGAVPGGIRGHRGGDVKDKSF